MEVSPEQPEKAPMPMVATEFGIVMEVSPEQPEKAPMPMVETESGI